MRIKILTFIMMLMVSVAGFWIHAEKLPVASFDKTTVDFGRFTEKNPKHQAVFTVKNTGNAPLIIVTAKASCGCTKPTYTQAPIMPGKTGTIKVEYNGSNRAIGPFNKTILVKTNGSPDQVRLNIKGDMQPSAK